MIVSRTRITAAAFAGLAAIALIGGCTSNKPGKVVTVTVPPPASSPSESASPTVLTNPSPSPTATALQRKLPGPCDSQLPDYSVLGAIGKVTLPGKDDFVVGLPETDIHRLAYINCQYGVTGSGATTVSKLQIGVSLYANAQDAAARITATVDDYTNNGAQSVQVKVGELSAMWLTGGSGDGYSDPLLVVASGQRTVAVTITKAVATGQVAATDATKLAELALSRTAP